MNKLQISLFFFSFLTLTYWQLNPQKHQSSRLPASASSGVIEVEHEGKLVAIVDDMDPMKSKHKTHYFLENSGTLKKINLNFQPDVSQLGKTVRFSGELKNGQLQGRLASGPQPLPPQPANFVDLRKMVVLLFKFQNSRRTYFTPAQLEYELFSGVFQRFFTEHTNGRIQHEGRVFGWYELPRNGEMGQSNMICEVMPDEVKQALAFYKVNIHDYDTVVMVSNCSEYFTVGGRANMGAYDFLGVGKPLHFIKMAGKPEGMAMPADGYVPGWSGLLPLLVHERGHNFMFGHANGMDCGSSDKLHPCEHVEYGNKFDKMGGSDGAIAFNGDAQRKVGWKKDSEFHHVRLPGSFTLDKVTSNKKNRKIGAYIYEQGTNKKLFYLETRKPGGLDNRLAMPHFVDATQGVLVYTNVSAAAADASPIRTNEFRIIDPKPSELSWWADTGTESMTDEYIDVMTGVIIRTEYSTPETTTFSVSYDNSIKRCDITGPHQWATTPYLARKSGSSEVIERKSRIGLAPGDEFEIRVDTLMSEERMCPRKTFTLKFSNNAEFADFIIPSSPGGGSGGDLPSEPQGRPTLPGGGGSGSYWSFNKSAMNVQQTHNFPKMKVPASALNKNFKVIFTYEFAPNDLRTHEITLYIRSDRKVPIEVLNPDRR